MLPKKRKFTPEDYDSYIVGSPSHVADEDITSEQPITSIATSSEERLSIQNISNSSVSEEVTSNNNDCEKVKTKIYHHGNEEAQVKSMGNLENEQTEKRSEHDNVGIDLSKRRQDVGIRRSSVQSPPPPQPFQQYASTSSAHLPFEQTQCNSRRNSSSIGEPYKTSCVPERSTGEVEGTLINRQHTIPLPHQRHRFMSSPITSAQYSSRNAIRINTPVGNHSLTRPRSAASDITQGTLHGRSDQIADTASQQLEEHSQYFPSQTSNANVSGGSIHMSHPTNPASSIQRQRLQHSFDVDLSDWIGHRILARRPSREGSCHYYWPGVIQGTYEDSRVSVSLDGEESPVVYDNVLSVARCGVVSDVIPSTTQVSTVLNFEKEEQNIIFMVLYYSDFVSLCTHR